MHSVRKTILFAVSAVALAACATTDPEITSQLEQQGDQIDQLSTQVEQLSASLDQLTADAEMAMQQAMAETPAFEVALAQFVMESAGFHEIADNLSDSGEIDPETISTVTRVARVTSQTAWPAELAGSAEHFQGMLADFAAAMADDDYDAALPLADMVHDHEHEFSSEISAWLGDAMPMDMDMEADHEHMHEEMSEEEMAAMTPEEIAMMHGVPAAAASVENPITADDASVSTGAELFALNCATCHGDNGEGDGPAAAGLAEPPADLHESHVQLVSDGGLFYIIGHGVADTPMPAWDEHLTADQIWHLVNFLRTFQEPMN